MASIGSFSGLASGIQWKDMIDQIMAAESSRQLDPITARSSAESSRRSALADFRSAVLKLSDAARKLRDGSAFDAIKVSAGTSPVSGRSLFSATATNAAAAGSYRVEVLGLAQAAKVGGAAVSSATDSMHLTGDFLINGHRIQVSDADSLSAIRDRINAANAGTTPSGVSASILSTGPTSNRLVLTSSTTGAAGMDLVDGDARLLRTLGLLSGDQVANVRTDGGTQTNRISSTTSVIAAAFGVTSPPPSTLKVGGKTISVDLSVDSLSSIAAKIAAQGVAASVVDEQVDGATRSRLVVGASVSADVTAGTDPTGAAAQRTLELLGFTRDDQAAVAQSLRTQNALTDASTSGAATGASLVTDLRSLASANGLLAGDTIDIRGTRGDGSAVTISFAVTAATTLNDLVTAINDPVQGFGGGSRHATASIVNGQIVLADDAGGDSQLSLALTTSRTDALDFGRGIVEQQGFSRRITDGADARFRIDGSLLTRSSNTVSDALAGVTLTLQQAEAGSVLDLSLARDVEGTVSAVQSFASAYNSVLSFVQKQTGATGQLGNDSSLRTSMSTFTNAMLTDVAGITGSSYVRSAIAGLALNKTGTLDLDADTLRKALAASPADVRRLFVESGTTTDNRLTYISSSANTTPGSHDVAITALPTAADARGNVLASGYVGGAPDVMTITDAASGQSFALSLSDGDSIDLIAQRLDGGFQANGLRLHAINDGGALRITDLDVGSATKFTVAFDAASAVAQLGIAAGDYAGTDVQGTIDGVVATGAGRSLTGASGSAADGLVVSYSGTDVGAIGAVSYVLGVGGMMQRATDAVTRTGDGLVDAQIQMIDSRTAALDKRAADIQARLDLRREALTRQYTDMETALSRIQAQQSWLASQINALSQNSN